MEGFIAILCSECGHRFRHSANFTDDLHGFEEFKCFCPRCLTELTITDNHQYDQDGNIIG